MPDKIHLLPDSVANQIAAGEVIQRPASVIKELVENAMDAGSTSVKIVAKDGGKTLIQVIDNGCGMSDTDARMSFERHATSKINEAKDLFAIRTLGFRGEALASIAAVAHVTLKTRRPEDELGTELIISGSDVESQETVACPSGSNLTVKNLFYNVPARRKFLKTNQAELKHIIYEFQRIALANPETEFSLLHNDVEIYNLSRTNLKQRIVHIFGKSINQNLSTVETDTSLVKIYGFIGKPEFAKKTLGEQFFFINRRFMKHPYFNKAILSAYEKLLPPNTVPSYFIYLEADPDTIDINIHPTKTEIKFENELAIFQILTAAIREALGRFNLVPSIDFNTEQAVDIPIYRQEDPVLVPEIPYNPNYNPFDEENKIKNYPDDRPMHANIENLKNWEKLYDFDGNPSESSQTEPSDSRQKELELQHSHETKNIIQLKGRYIITPVKSGLMVIDQKRAHERILFERYIHSLALNYPMPQRSLFPLTIEIDSADYLTLKEITADLHAIGFDISDFGNNTVVVNGCPADLTNPKPKELIESFLENYKTTESDLKVNIRENIARSMAVASSIRYGEQLTSSMMQELVDNLFACENPNYSPTGKPIVTIIQVDEIEKKLKITGGKND